MNCPYCNVRFHWKAEYEILGGDGDGRRYNVSFDLCPECERPIIILCEFALSEYGSTSDERNVLLYPATVVRTVPAKVPEEYTVDFREAHAVLAASPKASAALSRRCLQHIIREKTGIVRKQLVQEIDEVLKSKQLPTRLAEDLDAIRHVGNFAAHPTKDTNTGEILDVEDGEAEWLLAVLEGLFDFYFVQPAASARRRAALDTKLAAAGKQPMKVGS